MRHPVVRLGLCGLAVLAGAAATYRVSVVERSVTTARQTLGAIDGDLSTLRYRIADLRTGLEAYVAAGQGVGFWTPKVASGLDELAAGIAALSKVTTSPAAAESLRAAAESADELKRVDQRARDYLRSGEQLMASDVIFTEALATSTTLATQLDTLRQIELDQLNRVQHDAHVQQVLAVGAGGAAVLIVLLLLTPAGRGSRENHVPADAVLAEAFEPDLTARAPHSAPGAEAPAPAPIARPVNLATMAAVCTELGQLTDTSTLPALLGRAAELLDASAIIVWVASAGGHELRPALVHGYPPAFVARMPPLARDADNATAGSWRSSELRVVGATGGGYGALVAPILTPNGCVGVLAAEIRHGAERRNDVQAAAMVVAAQLATIVEAAPPDSTGTEPDR